MFVLSWCQVRPSEATTSEDTREDTRDFTRQFRHFHTSLFSLPTFSDLHPTIDNFSQKYAKENRKQFPFLNPEFRKINLFAFIVLCE